MRCPGCRNKLLQKSGSSTRLRTHGPIEFTENGICKAQCYWCKTPVEVPGVKLQTSEPIEVERFVVKK